MPELEFDSFRAVALQPAHREVSAVRRPKLRVRSRRFGMMRTGARLLFSGFSLMNFSASLRLCVKGLHWRKHRANRSAALR